MFAPLPPMWALLTSALHSLLSRWNDTSINSVCIFCMYWLLMQSIPGNQWMLTWRLGWHFASWSEHSWCLVVFYTRHCSVFALVWGLRSCDLLKLIRQVSFHYSPDTAAVYRNEAAIGAALTRLLPAHSLTRKDIFITTKLGKCTAHLFHFTYLATRNCHVLFKLQSSD